MPDEDKNFGGALVLNFRKRWRHAKTIYMLKYRVIGYLIWSPIGRCLEIINESSFKGTSINGVN